MKKISNEKKGIGNSPAHMDLLKRADPLGENALGSIRSSLYLGVHVGLAQKEVCVSASLKVDAKETPHPYQCGAAIMSCCHDLTYGGWWIKTTVPLL